MGHLLDFLTIMFGFPVNRIINRNLQKGSCAIYVGENTYNINYLLPARLNRI
jgi:hypothetical protein